RRRRDVDGPAGCWRFSLAGRQRAHLRAHHPVHRHHRACGIRPGSNDEFRRTKVQDGMIAANKDKLRFMSYLELKNVAKGFDVNGGWSEVLNNINLSVDKGEFVSIVGYSGVGKTTLISMIAGLLKQD